MWGKNTDHIKLVTVYKRLISSNIPPNPNLYPNKKHGIQRKTPLVPVTVTQPIRIRLCVKGAFTGRSESWRCHSILKHLLRIDDWYWLVLKHIGWMMKITNQYQSSVDWWSAWWYTTPSEKYEFGSRGYEIPNRWKHKQKTNHQPVINVSLNMMMII